MSERAHILVVGNEKGGTGKSTVAMHVIVSLLREGFSVASIDLDARQATLTRYIENRRRKSAEVGGGLALPEHKAITASDDRDADRERLDQAVESLASTHQVLVIDTPGADNPLSRAGHSYANTLLTPMNDSFVDLDVLATVDPTRMRIARPSHYAEMVWETKKARALKGEMAPVDWVVMRNRLSTLDARNKRDVERLLVELSKRIGFRFIDGLCERVIYRELFLQGLTLLDLGEEHGHTLQLSHVAARQELRNLTEALGLGRLLVAERAG